MCVACTGFARPRNKSSMKAHTNVANTSCARIDDNHALKDKQRKPL